MPHMTGPEATTQIREYLHEQNLFQPIIAGVTSYQDQKHIQNALKSGMNVVFEKTPFPKV